MGLRPDAQMFPGGLILSVIAWGKVRLRRPMETLNSQPPDGHLKRQPVIPNTWVVKPKNPNGSSGLWSTIL